MCLSAKRLASLSVLVCAILASCGPPSWPGGVHAVFGWSAGGVRVAKVPDRGPAAQAGLHENDRLVAIDGQPVQGLSSAQVQKLLSGEVGSIAVLTVEREAQTLDVRVERAPYQPKPR